MRARLVTLLIGTPLGAPAWSMSFTSVPSEKGTAENVSTSFTRKPRPEHGRDCLICARLGLTVLDVYVNLALTVLYGSS